MSNPTGAFGLRPVRLLNGGSWAQAVMPVYISASYATALYKGDPVIKDNEADDADATGYRFTVEKATVTDGGIIHGVIVGFEPLVTDLSKQYNPASTERIAYMIPSEGVVFEIRGCGGGTPSSLWQGQNAVMVDGTANSSFGLSGVVLDEGTATAPSADQSNPLYILNVKNVADNELGDYAIYEVLINTPVNATGYRLGVVAS